MLFAPPAYVEAMMSRIRSRLPRTRSLIASVGVLAFSLLSCGREITGPGEGVRFATGLSFVAEFPAPLASVAAGAGSVVPFERVRIVFRRADATIALDTFVNFPSNADSIALDLRVPLAAAARPRQRTAHSRRRSSRVSPRLMVSRSRAWR